jgi:biopolymer transport protein ExbD
MVDVVFVLLLFFMALAGLRQVEQQIDQKLPGGGGLADLPLVIDITSSGAISCNGLQLAANSQSDPAKLRAWLKEIGSTEPNTPVVIRPAADAEHGRFIDVLSSLHEAGFKKIGFS